MVERGRLEMSLEHSPSRKGAAGTGQSYTVTEFCELERLSRAQLYKLWKLKRGPRFYFAGTSDTHRRITEQARLDWHHEAEARAAAAETALDHGEVA
jgi:hypothetical protein